MQVWTNADQIPDNLGPTAVTIGVFDGVHRGHQAILTRTAELARHERLASVALTFDPHPAHVHRPDQTFDLVASLTDRLERMAATGIDAAYVQRYTLDYADVSAEEFIDRDLIGLLGARLVVVGEDARFGRDNEGDVELLRRVCEARGVQVDVVVDVVGDGHSRRWSSTWVREALGEGSVAEAATVLGRPHRMRGVVVHGEKRGRELGYPTANLDPDDLGLVPADGVYAGWLIRSGSTDRLPAAISVGTNVTFDAVARTVEAHVLGRTDLDLYDEEVVVELVAHLRPMLKFNGIDELLDAMRDDVLRTANILDVPVPPAPTVPDLA